MYPPLSEVPAVRIHALYHDLHAHCSPHEEIAIITTRKHIKGKIHLLNWVDWVDCDDTVIIKSPEPDGIRKSLSLRN